MKKVEEIDKFNHIVSLEHLRREIEYEFNLICSEIGLKGLAEHLNILEAKKASIQGTLKVQTEEQIFLNAIIKAKLIQPCSLTLEPIVTNINKQILRTFFIGSNKKTKIKKNIFELDEKSFDHDMIMDEINLGDVLLETISLETPDYPKKSGASINLAPTDEINVESPFSILSKLKE
jgi:hypothetical protein